MTLGLTSSKAQTGTNKTVRMPTKQSINLANVNSKPIKLYIALPAIILIIAAAVLLSKFAVVDRLMQVSAAEYRVATLRTELSAAYEKLASFDDLNEKYAHYTYSGMTAEELHRVDRCEVIALIQRVILPELIVDSWSVTGNQLTMSVTGSSLQTVNLMVQKLYEEPIVDYCTVRTASTTETSYQTSKNEESDLPETETDVVSQVIVFLTAAVEEG